MPGQGQVQGQVQAQEKEMSGQMLRLQVLKLPPARLYGGGTCISARARRRLKTRPRKARSSKGKKRSRSGSNKGGKPKACDNESQYAPKSGAVPPVTSDQDVRDHFVALHNAQATAKSQMRIHDLELLIKEEELKVMLQQVKDMSA